MRPSTNLPPPYELITLPTAADVLGAARRLAETGAEEGTLLWAPPVAADADRRTRWPAPLRWCLILRPDFARASADQLVYVGAVSLAETVAESMPPLTVLHYRWPDEVWVNGALAGRIRLSVAPARDPPAWLLVAAEVHPDVQACTPGRDADADYDDVLGDVDPCVLLEGFARHFLSWLNRWADEGLTPVLKGWRHRAEGLSRPVRLQLNDGVVQGVATQVDDDGSLVLDTGAGHVRRVSVREYLAGNGITEQ